MMTTEEYNDKPTGQTPKTYTETEVKALIAAALQNVAHHAREAMMIVAPEGIGQRQALESYRAQFSSITTALIPTDHAAALEAVKAQEWNRALEWAADHVEGYASPELSMMADAIRAGKVQP